MTTDDLSTDLSQARAKRNGHGVKKGSHDIVTVIEASVLSLIPPPSVPHRFSRTSIEMEYATSEEIFMPWERGKLNTPVHSAPQANSIEDDLSDNLDFIPVRNDASHQFRLNKGMEKLSSTHKVIGVSKCCPRWVHVRQDSSVLNQNAFPCLRLSLPKDVTPHFTRHEFMDIAQKWDAHSIDSTYCRSTHAWPDEENYKHRDHGERRVLFHRRF
jgi:hypothetical protein